MSHTQLYSDITRQLQPDKIEFMEVKTININENQELAMKTLNPQLCKKAYISELVLQLLKDS